MNADYYKTIELTQNPFPSAASGLGGILDKCIYLPRELEDKIKSFFETMNSHEGGVKIFPIVGEYGAGKSAILKGWLKFFFEKEQYHVVYFDNPGVDFYDLANTLMKSLGRYEFSKAIWEYAKQDVVKINGSPYLFEDSFESMLCSLTSKELMSNMTRTLERVIYEKLDFTNDREVAHKLAQLVVETKKKTYFDARDFEVRQDSLVPIKEEAKFFTAIVRATITLYNVRGVIFLIDEFEEIAISDVISKHKRYAYLATLRKLIDFSELENLWIAISMTHEAKQVVSKNNPALWQRFSNNEMSTIELEPFNEGDVRNWLEWWLERYRSPNAKESLSNPIFPFTKGCIRPFMDSVTRRTPRKLVKAFFQILAEGRERNLSPDGYSQDFVKSIVESLYPQEDINDEQ